MGNREHHYARFLTELGSATRLHDFGDIQSSEAESRAMCALLQEAFSLAVGEPGPWDQAGPLLFVFGSFGRMDGRIPVSDIDPLLVMDGTGNAADRFAAGCELIQRLVRDNRCLNFPSAQEILAGSFNFRTRLSYPILCSEQLADRDLLATARRIQILFESRCLSGNGRGTIRTALSRYRTRFTECDLTEVARDLVMFHDNFFREFLPEGGGLDGAIEVEPLTRKAHLKLRLFREALVHVTCCSLVDLCREPDVEGTVKRILLTADTPLFLRPLQLCTSGSTIIDALDGLGNQEDKGFTRLWIESKEVVGPLQGADLDAEEEGFRWQFPSQAGTSPKMEFIRNVRFASYFSMLHASSAFKAIHDPELRDTLDQVIVDWSTRRIPELRTYENRGDNAVSYLSLCRAYVHRVVAMLRSHALLADNKWRELESALETVDSAIRQSAA